MLEDFTPAQGNAEAEAPTSVTEASPTSETTQPTTDPTTSPALESASGTAPAEAPDVPPFHEHPRWQQMLARNRELEERTNQLNPWQPVIEQLTAQGLNPQQIAEYLQNPAPQPEPEPDPQAEDAEFEAYLRGKSLDVYDLDSDRLDVQRELFLLHQERQSFQKEREQATQQQQVQRFQTEYAQYAAQPGNELFQDKTITGFAELAYEKFGAPAAQIAQLLKAPIDALVQAKLAEYQQGKREDASTPVTAGGGAADPHPNRQSIHDASLSEAERINRMASFVEAYQGAGANG